MSPRRRKILGYITTFLSVDVFIAAIIALIGAWVGLTAINGLLVNLFQAGERATAVADSALTQVDTTMTTFQVKAQNLSADVAQVVQNVSDKGIILTLLPPDKETALSEKIDELRQTVDQVKEAIDSVRTFMQALSNLPFIQVPRFDSGPLQKVDAFIQQVAGIVQTVKQGLSDIRAGTATAIQIVANALQQISDAVLQARVNLVPLRGYVQSANQVILPFLTAFSPIFFFVIALIFSILYGWTIYVMFRMIKWSNAWRKGASPSLMPNPVAAAGVSPAPLPSEAKSSDQK
jgi:methyl-accepting chemotaxis protein